MPERHIPRRVENYTNAFLVMMGVLTFMALWTIAALAGTVWMLASAAGVELILRRFRR